MRGIFRYIGSTVRGWTKRERLILCRVFYGAILVTFVGASAVGGVMATDVAVPLAGSVASVEGATEAAGDLVIPAIALVTEVEELEAEDHRLATPDYVAGAYAAEAGRTLLIGHSTTVFSFLPDVAIGDEIYFRGERFVVTRSVTVLKADVRMGELLRADGAESIVLMTCAGEILEGGDATERLLITAVRED